MSGCLLVLGGEGMYGCRQVGWLAAEVFWLKLRPFCFA